MPRFSTTIDNQTFERASEYVKSIGYTGPVCISCDDTKLHPALRTYWDPTKKCHFIIGTTGDPIPVEDENNIREQIADAKEHAAKKVKLVLPIPPYKCLTFLADTGLGSAHYRCSRHATHCSGGKGNPREHEGG